MDLQRADIILEKINSLYKSISLSDNPSAIERDLMLRYVQQLYESFLHDDISPKAYEAPKPPPPPPAPKPQPAYQPPRIIEVPDNLQRPTSTVTTPPPAPPQPTPPPPAPQPEPRPEPIAPPQPEQPVRRPDRPAPAPTTPKKYAALFEFKEASDLSEKLGTRPIQDLTKSLAINDRLLYMNELFGRDLNALNDSLSQLNKYDNLDEAKELLVQLADRYDWASDDRMGTARDFVRLIRRRYL